jgi:hypothetical protein
LSKILVPVAKKPRPGPAIGAVERMIRSLGLPPAK